MLSLGPACKLNLQIVRYLLSTAFDAWATRLVPQRSTRSALRSLTSNSMGSDGIRSKVWQKTVAFDYDGVEPMVFCVFRKAEGAVMICVVKNAGFTKSNLVLYGDWATTSGYWPTIGWWFHSLFTKTWDDDPQGLIVSGCFNQSTRPVCFIQTSMDHYGNSDIHNGMDIV